MNDLPAELFDIVEPVQAVTAGSNNLLVITLAMALVASVLVLTRWWLQNKERWYTLRRLRRLQRDFTAGAMTARTLAYAIAAELCRRLQTHRLRSTQPIAGLNEAQANAWRNFVARLDRLRYQPGRELNPQQVDVLVREAVDWVRRSR